MKLELPHPNVRVPILMGAILKMLSSVQLILLEGDTDELDFPEGVPG
jgi:hypothetical protein